MKLFNEIFINKKFTQFQLLANSMLFLILGGLKKTGTLNIFQIILISVIGTIIIDLIHVIINKYYIINKKNNE